jgi:integrase/recombinase XerD
MQDLIEQFRKELLAIHTFKADTVQNYISLLYRYVDYAHEHLSIDPLKSTARDLRDFMDAQRKDYSHSRLIHIRSALIHFFAFLVRTGIIPENPAEALFPIRKEKSDKNQPISHQTAFKLLNAIDRTKWIGERNFIIISIFWALGLRLKELVTLKVRDFESGHDPENNIGLLRIHGKGDKQRALFVVDTLYAHLVHYLNHPESPKKKSESLFPVQQNKTISTDRVQRMMKEYAHSAGISERITPHVLRHSFATEMYHQGVPLYAVQAMLGHENQAESAIYIHVSDELEKQALENIIIEGRMSWQ